MAQMGVDFSGLFRRRSCLAQRRAREAPHGGVAVAQPRLEGTKEGEELGPKAMFFLVLIYLCILLIY